MKTQKIILIIFLLSILLSVFSITVFADDYFILNTESGKFHRKSCSYLPGAEKRERLDIEEIEFYENISPCKHCNPLNYISDEDDDVYSDYDTKQDKENASLWFLEVVVQLFACVTIYAGGAGFFGILSKQSEYHFHVAILGEISFFLLAFFSIAFFFVIKNYGILDIFNSDILFLSTGYFVSIAASALWCLINRKKLSI